jgi:4'-phosphopantetheinyl transferase
MSGFEVYTQALDWPEDAPVPDILSAEERERRARFVRAADRARYAQSHVFLREALSRFTAEAATIAPAEWQFAHGEHGRPKIANPPAGFPIDFNLSHTKDYAACVVTRGAVCGIDIERVRSDPEFLNIARSHFAPEEYRALAELAEDARPRRFFELWTEKEAWAKACGLGLALPLDRVVAEIPGVTLERFEPTLNHALAVVLIA